MPGDFRCDRGDYCSCAFYPFLHARLRVHWAPGIPHALFRKGRTFMSKPRAKTRGEIADSHLAVIARSASDEAIHSFFLAFLLSCFLAFLLSCFLAFLLSCLLL